MLKIKYVFILIHLISNISTFTEAPHQKIVNTFTLYLGSLINTSITNNKNLSHSCKETLTDLYINGTDSWYYLHKLVYDSSHNQGDTTPLNACKRKTHGVNKTIANNDDLTYLMLLVDKREINRTVLSIITDTLLYYYGFCIAKTNCEDYELKSIIHSTLDEFDLGFNATVDNFTLYHIDKYSFKIKNLVNLIPMYILIIQIIFMFWNNLAIQVAKFISYCCCCIKTKRKNDNENEHENTFEWNMQNISREAKKMKKKKLRKIIIGLIKNSFNVTQNAEELYSIHKESDVHNNMGITYIKGIRSVAMIFLLGGSVFINLFSSPIYFKDQDMLIKILSSYLYPIIIIGVKFSPKILFSCSGFELLYKLLCYLDDRVEEERKKKIELSKSSEDQNSRISSKNDDESSSSIESGIKIKDNFRVKDLLHRKYFCRFITYQFHKYLMYVLFLSFIYFCLFELVVLLNGVKPLWIYFNEKIVNSISMLETILSYLLIRNIFIETGNQDSIINVFYLVINEIIFFLISSFIVFISYKYSFLLNRILLILIVGLFVFRNIIYSTRLPQMNATNYFTYTYYGLYSTFPTYNYLYYLIGMFFSLINYSFQKGMNYSLARKQEKSYVYPIIKLISMLKKIKMYQKQIIKYVSFTLILLIPFIQCLILKILALQDKNQIFTKYLNNKFFGFLLMYDSDFYIFLIHLFCFISYMQGNNIIIRFLSGRIWNILDKLYFSYIIYLNPLILYVLYQGETMVSLTINYVFFVSTVCGFIIFILCSVTYIFLELPYKKLIYFSLNINRKEHKVISFDTYQSDSSILRDKLFSDNSLVLYGHSETE